MTVGTFFDGTNDEIVLASNDFTMTSTFSVWGMVYINSAATARYCISAMNGATSAVTVSFDGGNIAIDSGGNTPPWFTVFTTPNWYFFCITKASGTVAPKLYLTTDGSTWTKDGAAADAGTLANLANGTINDFRIGSVLGSNFWNGEIVALGISNTELSGTTAKSLINYSNWSGVSGLQFNTGQTMISGGTVNDSSSVNNDETSRVGATTGSQTIPGWFSNFGADTNVAVQSAAVTATANAPTITRTDPYAVASAGAAVSTASPSVTFSGYTPLENDVIAFYISSTTAVAVVANASLPSGWVNPLGDGVEVNADTCGMGCLYHKVTAGEETAVTLTYTATSSITSTTGYVQAVAIRNVDPANVVDGFNTAFDSSNTVTPHVLASITGSGVLLDNSLVVSSVTKDATGAYSSVPGGWTQLRADNTNNGRWLGYRSTNTVLNTDVTATNITPSAGDEYASITLAFAQKPTGTNVTVGNAAVTVAGGNTGISNAHDVGSAAVTVAGNSVTVSRRVDVGVAAVTATANNTGVSAAHAVGNAAVTVTANNSGAAVAHAVGNAAVTVAGNNATVTTGADSNVTVGSAAVTVTANSPVIGWPIFDLFPYSNGSLTAANPTLWSTVTGTMDGLTLGGSLQVASNEIASPVDELRVNQLVPQFGTNDQYVTAYAFNAATAQPWGVGVFCRLDATGMDGYAAWIFWSSDGLGGYQYGLFRYDDGVGTVLGSLHAADTSDHFITVQAIGNTITMYSDIDVIESVTDSTYPTQRGSSIAIYGFTGAAPRIGSFEAGIATGSGNVNVTVGSAAVTATANNSGISAAHAVGNAAVTATANNSSAAVAPTTGSAAVTATANNSGAAVAPTIGSAAVTVTANNVTVSAGADVNVAVGSAAVTATVNNTGISAAHAVGNAAVTSTANNVTAAPSPSAGSAAVTVTANNTGISAAHAVGNAAVTATANDSGISNAHAVGVATVTVTANNATVSTSAQTNVTVGVATVTAVANDSGVSAAHAVGVAAVTVAGNQITAAPALTVGSAAVSATANNVGAAVAAAVLYALVLVAGNQATVDNGAGVATLIGLIRAARPDLTRVSRPYPHRAQRPEV